MKKSKDKVKKPLGQRLEELKVKAKDYKAAISKAIDLGYSLGWEAHSKLPKVRGAHMASSYGFAKGLREHKRTDKYTSRAERSARKSPQYS